MKDKSTSQNMERSSRILHYKSTSFLRLSIHSLILKIQLINTSFKQLIMPRKTSLALDVEEQNINEESIVKPGGTSDTQNTVNDVIEIHTPFYKPLTKEELANVNVEHKKAPKKEYLWKLTRCKYMLTIKLCDGKNLI